jgi:hypothetical protein
MCPVLLAKWHQAREISWEPSHNLREQTNPTPFKFFQGPEKVKEFQKS